jgi:hypothetical protein
MASVTVPKADLSQRGEVSRGLRCHNTISRPWDTEQGAGARLMSSGLPNSPATFYCSPGGHVSFAPGRLITT